MQKFKCKMSNSKSYADVLKGSINTRNKTVVMDIFETQNFEEWSLPRNVAVELLNHAKTLKLQLKLDKLTLGNNSCFMIAVLQQCQRPEIKIYCPDEVIRMSEKFDFMEFRNAVSNFMITSNHPSILAYKKRYEDTDMTVTKMSWRAFWNHMRSKTVWADGHFVQGAAFYLGIDIWTMATTSKEDQPYIKIFGNLEDPNNPGVAPPIILGLKGNCHYQSLLPIEIDNLIPERVVSYAEVVRKNSKENKIFFKKEANGVQDEKLKPKNDKKSSS